MRALPLLLITLLAAPALAGCLQTPNAADAAPLPRATLWTLPWDLVECRVVVAWVEVDPALLVEYLPAGFEVDTHNGRLAPVRGESGLFAMEAFQCKEGTGLAGEVVPEMAYGSFWASVIAPEALRGDAEMFFAKWDVVIPDAARRAQFVAAGAPVHDGSVGFEPVAGAPVPGAFHAWVEMGDLGRMTFDFVPTGQPSTGRGFVFREYTPATDGLIVWETDFTSTMDQNGRGVVTFPPGSMGAKIVGAEQTEAEMTTGEWTFGGSAQLLAWP